jgi:hypothetical protein
MALRMCATDPIDYLIRPRFFGLLIDVSRRWWCSRRRWHFLRECGPPTPFFGINPRTFANVSMVSVGDLTIGLTKVPGLRGSHPRDQRLLRAHRVRRLRRRRRSHDSRRGQLLAGRDHAELRDQRRGLFASSAEGLEHGTGWRFIEHQP